MRKTACVRSTLALVTRQAGAMEANAHYSIQLLILAAASGPTYALFFDLDKNQPASPFFFLVFSLTDG